MPSIKRKLHEIRRSMREDIGRYGSEWMETQPVFLGDYTQTVTSPTPGIYYARQYNGKVIEVFNAVNMPATFDLHVIIGRKKSQPTRWQIIEERDVYLTPPFRGGVGHHAAQHMLNGGDRLPVDRKQIIQFTVLVTDAANFIVGVYGGVARTGTTIVRIPTQFLDFSSYVVSEGAKYVAIEIADDGTLSLNEGIPFASVETGTSADIPLPDEGKHTLAFVALYESQAALGDNDIVVLMPIALSPPEAGDADTTEIEEEIDVINLALDEIHRQLYRSQPSLAMYNNQNFV